MRNREIYELVVRGKVAVVESLAAFVWLDRRGGNSRNRRRFNEVSTDNVCL